jgi:(p)ppGpp synthase/HD superfamily hydrolase
MTHDDSALLIRSGLFRDAAHDSIKQVRKYTGEPYKNHPRQVRETVLEYGGSILQAVMADQHDVLEDVWPKNPYYSPELIGNTFGLNVLLGVQFLTNVFTREAFPGWNRKKRHEAEMTRLGFIPPEIATVKLADIKVNTSDILWQDPEFARVYLREKADEISFLRHGDVKLWHDTDVQITRGLHSLQ